jgi:hypothetical protein
MSPQLPTADGFSLEALGDELVFGDAQSSLAIPKTVMEQLWAQMNEGVRKLARGGLEVGGLLVGPKGCEDRVLVDGIIPLTIEYLYGPSFRMSYSDRAKIVPAIESVQHDPSRAVVGFYRSRTRGDETLRTSDHEIFDAIEYAIETAHSSFEADFRCCLVLAPTSESTASACIAMRHQDRWDEIQPIALQSDPLSIIESLPPSPLPQVIRDPRAQAQAIALSIPLPISTPRVQPVVDRFVPQIHVLPSRAEPPAEHVVQVIAKPPVPDPEVQTPVPAKPSVGFPHAPTWVYAVVGLVAFAGATLGYIMAVGTAPHRAAHFGLSAALDSTVWKLSWNPEAIDQLHPAGAVLSIEDGPVQQLVQLTAADLASGTILYTPQNAGDITFSLRIDRAGEPIEEQVRVLGKPGIAEKKRVSTRISAPKPSAATGSKH